MYTYEVQFKVDGKGPTRTIYVEAKDSSSARRAALAEISGMAGYADKRISIVAVFKR